MNHTDYDYIIVGAGCAGLSLAYALTQSPTLRHKRVLLLDSDAKQANDRTWCFWEDRAGRFEAVVHHRWEKLLFRSPAFQKTFSIAPYEYKMIQGDALYRFAFEQLAAFPNFEFRQAEVSALEEGASGAKVTTHNDIYRANMVFNTAIWHEKIDRSTCNYVSQHFKGWVIRTPDPMFDPSTATFMDFDIEQEDETRFFYILPTDAHTALVEIAIFSNDILDTEHYDALIRAYIKDKLAIHEYEVIHTEIGVIPMTDYDFTPTHKSPIVRLGTVGGAAKPSTGYVFQGIQAQVTEVVRLLEAGAHPCPERSFLAQRFQRYDSTMLNVILNKRVAGQQVFAHLFKKVSPALILRFLEERTTFFEEIQVMASMPVAPFARAFVGEGMRSRRAKGKN